MSLDNKHTFYAHKFSFVTFIVLTSLAMFALTQILIFILLARGLASYKILAIFPTPSVSHQVIFQPLVQELARRGHDVTVLTPDPMYAKGNSPENLTEIDVHDLSYKKWRDGFVNNVEFGNKRSIFQQLDAGVDVMTKVVEGQLKTNEMQRLIKDPNVKFDLLLLEAWTRQALVYSHLFKAPVILVSSFGMMFGNAETVGAPSHPFLYPSFTRQRLYNLTFWDKINQFYYNYWLSSIWYSKESKEIKIFRKLLGDDLPDYNELRNNVDMLFLNSHEVWLDNQPLPPNVISIWGIHKKPVKPLPHDLKTYLDSAKQGVIYLSFGTNAPSSTLPREFIQLLIQVLSKLPYDVLWKWETDELPGKSDNIKTRKWFPQSDLLRHPNIKLFITQGGLQSTDEAITAGVPLIGIPMLGDQWYNVEKYEKHGIGIKLDMETITKDELETAIKTVINSPSFKTNIVKLRSIMSDQPESALSRAVWWTEYVLRHGGAKHLRSPAANMPATTYYEMPLVLTLGLLLLSLLMGLGAATYLLFQYFTLRIKIKVS